MDTLQSQIEDIEASFCTELLDSNQAVEEAQIALNREKRRLCEAFITAASDLREKIIDTPSVFKETKARHKITEFIVN